MQPKFWLDAWRDGRTGFHRDEVHPDLLTHAPWFLGQSPKRVLVPLSGQSVDLAWMAEQGHHVVGAELSRDAVCAQFEAAGRVPEVTPMGTSELFEAGNLRVVCGNFFEFPAGLGPFERVWDRAALVALPPPMRRDYAIKVRTLAPGATLLLNAFEYDTTIMDGPPFSVHESEVRDHYREHQVEILETRDDIHQIPKFIERGHHWWKTTVYRITG